MLLGLVTYRTGHNGIRVRSFPVVQLGCSLLMKILFNVKFGKYYSYRKKMYDKVYLLALNVVQYSFNILGIVPSFHDRALLGSRLHLDS